MQTIVADTEVYENYFLASFMNVETGNVREFEMYPGSEPLNMRAIAAILSKYRIVTFNGVNYDMPILTKALRKATCSELKALSERIIVEGVRYWEHDFEVLKCDHVDLIEVAPGMASLKIYGGRLHAAKLQDLPIEPSALITPEQRPLMRSYCRNDLQTTTDLFNRLKPQIELREAMSAETDIDLRSKSDAQIAEAVIKKGVEARLGTYLDKPGSLAGTTVRYDVPEFISFSTPDLNAVLNVVKWAQFPISDKGKVEMPEEVARLSISMGSSTYRMGIGGLHSTEKSVAHHADDDHILVDRDVTGYYPDIILNCDLRPAQMDHHFSHVYRGIVTRRVEAKRRKDAVVSDSLKIVVNGSFGKFGSPYSRLYSPKLLIQTTITGQLALLMLIEMLEQAGISVVSANTDGVVILCHRTMTDVLAGIITAWEKRTGLGTEETCYRSLYSRDVNNYIAIKTDGSVKLKGAYAPPGLQKNPTNQISTDAVVAFLKDGKHIVDTILECRDIRRFVTVRQVKGGAVDQQGEYLGKAVRWYYAEDVEGCLCYKSNGYTVARSAGAKPLMELPDRFPEDLDFLWYAEEAMSILKDVGA